MSTLRVTNIEAKGDPSSPSVDEKLKLTNSTGDVVLEVDGKNVGAGQTVFVGSGIVTATTVSIAGSITATNFYGNASNLSGIDATALKDSGGSVMIQANTSGAVITGMTTVTDKLMVGDSYIAHGSVGLGTTTSSGRDAGIGTATGTVIYVPETGMQIYTGAEQGWRTLANTEASVSEITGGTKTTVGSRTYHTFTSSGTLVASNASKTANFIVVAGGGGGGNWGVGGAGGNGGGGAGGIVAGTALPITDGTYTITIGAGGASTGANPAVPTSGNKGGANTTIASPTITTITAKGGGEGGDDESDTAQPGGSGGGGGGSNAYNNTGSATQPGTNSLYGATDYGNAGGQGIPGAPYTSGGGGGAGGAGGNGTPSLAGAGGVGQPFDLTFTPTDNGTSGPAPGRYFGGGGGGSGYNNQNTQNVGGAGGGANGHMPGDPQPFNGTANTGGGGGGGKTSPDATSYTQNGGSGVVIISYT